MNTEATKDPGSAAPGRRAHARPYLEAARAARRVLAIASGFVSGVAAYALPGAATQHRVWLALHALVGLVVGTAVLRARGLRIPPG